MVIFLLAHDKLQNGTKFYLELKYTVFRLAAAEHPLIRKLPIDYYY